MKKLLFSILIIFLVSTILQIQPVFGSKTPVFFTTSSDGVVTHSHSNYNVCWTTSYGEGLDDAYSFLNIGQENAYPFNYWIYRSFVFFDTSSIPDNVIIEEAKLSLYGKTDESVLDFNITIQNGQPTYPHDPLLHTDYFKNYYSGNGGQFDTSNFTTSGYNTITLNADGRSWINTKGITKFCLRSDKDIAGIAPPPPPDGKQQVIVYSYEQGEGYRPKLTATYTILITEQTENAALVLATLFGLFVVVLGIMIVVRKEIPVKEVVSYLTIICVFLIFAMIFTGWES